MSKKKDDRTPLERNKDRIRTVLSESLDSYALVGFTPSGDEVTIMHTPNDLHVRAINEAFKAWYDEAFAGEEVEAELEEDETEAWMSDAEDEE